MDQHIGRWFNPRKLRQFLEFEGNIVGGAKMRNHIHRIAYGKFYTGPSDAQDCLRVMVDLNILRPSKFNPVVNGTVVALGLSYSTHHIRHVISQSLTRGTEDSWCFEVVSIPRGWRRSIPF